MNFSEAMFICARHNSIKTRFFRSHGVIQGSVLFVIWFSLAWLPVVCKKAGFMLGNGL